MNRFKLYVFIPEVDKETFKKAVFAKGAGQQGNYEQCCFETSGIGQFKPGVGSNPYLGKQNKLEHVSEVKLEFLVLEDKLKDVIDTLHEVHPYEEPAYDLVKLHDVNRNNL